MRSLPKRHNQLILPDASPDYDDLLARRRLGKTNLTVKPAQIGTSNATKPENLGLFEYAHLRAPLPKDLKGSEIFPSHNPQQHPETYFLMRRSKDGFISATGMFKIAFPWAKLEEERAEREYLKSRSDTSEDETAGNVWISPMLALELSKDYHMFDWVRALLDPAEIVQTSAAVKKQITPPPRFEMRPLENLAQFAPTPRTRSRRSASPSKTPSGKKLLTPRKPRQTRAAKETSTAVSNAASAALLQTSLDTAAWTGDSESVDGAIETFSEVNGEEQTGEELKAKKDTRSKMKKAAAPIADEMVKVDVESTVGTPNGIETAQTMIAVEMPVALPDLPPTADTEEMIAEAKRMVEEATIPHTEDAEAGGEPSDDNASKKRKSEELVEESERAADSPTPPAKKARILEDKLRRERVRNRALIGVTATLALAAAIPYFL
ncbi:hypothetical protein Egran_01238 [Elaphomyces granulatus]|uniref:Cell pattern formation-associated protein stuA n=1 Tax=Elaphomyces granulatus TaxID=519963 RepID=A0A232M3L4_9EURO|nr:hypothetical protein Egran_01238 [Elaphomyces granulatus]